MDKFLNSIWAKLLRILLPVATLVMGAIPGSYIKEIPIAGENGSTAYIKTEITHYFQIGFNGVMDWAPAICIALCLVSVVCAVICYFKETENTLTVLANMLCMGLVAELLIIIFLAPTVLGWCIAGALGIDLIITAAQEMKLEDANRK